MRRSFDLACLGPHRRLSTERDPMERADRSQSSHSCQTTACDGSDGRAGTSRRGQGHHMHSSLYRHRAPDELDAEMVRWQRDAESFGQRLRWIVKVQLPVLG